MLSLAVHHYRIPFLIALEPFDGQPNYKELDGQINLMLHPIPVFLSIQKEREAIGCL